MFSVLKKLKMSVNKYFTCQVDDYSNHKSALRVVVDYLNKKNTDVCISVYAVVYTTFIQFCFHNNPLCIIQYSINVSISGYQDIVTAGAQLLSLQLNHSLATVI